MEGLSGADGGRSRLVGAPGSSGVPAWTVGDSGVAASGDDVDDTSSAFVGASTAGCSKGCCSATGTSGAGGTGISIPDRVKNGGIMQHIARMSEKRGNWTGMHQPHGKHMKQPRESLHARCMSYRLRVKVRSGESAPPELPLHSQTEKRKWSGGGRGQYFATTIIDLFVFHYGANCDIRRTSLACREDQRTLYRTNDEHATTCLGIP